MARKRAFSPQPVPCRLVVQRNQTFQGGCHATVKRDPLIQQLAKTPPTAQTLLCRRLLLEVEQLKLMLDWQRFNRDQPPAQRLPWASRE